MFPFYKARSPRFREVHNSPKVTQDSRMEVSSESRGTKCRHRKETHMHVALKSVFPPHYVATALTKLT